MCLRKIDRRTMPEEGEAYKVYEITPVGLKSIFIHDTVLPNQWMLYKNPENGCHVDCRVGKIFGIGKRYEHGFHLWKTLEDAEEDLSMAVSIQGMYSNPRQKHFKIVKVRYRGYIAEDKYQIVAKQIFVSVLEESVPVVKDEKIIGVSVS